MALGRLWESGLVTIGNRSTGRRSGDIMEKRGLRGSSHGHRRSSTMSMMFKGVRHIWYRRSSSKYLPDEREPDMQNDATTINRCFRLPQSNPVLAEIVIDAIDYHRFEQLNEGHPE